LEVQKALAGKADLTLVPKNQEILNQLLAAGKP
jgi:hypothetical protein